MAKKAKKKTKKRSQEPTPKAIPIEHAAWPQQLHLLIHRLRLSVEALAFIRANDAGQLGEHEVETSGFKDEDWIRQWHTQMCDTMVALQLCRRLADSLPLSIERASEVIFDLNRTLLRLQSYWDEALTARPFDSEQRQRKDDLLKNLKEAEITAAALPKYYTISHADDFSWVEWGGTRYLFSKGQQANAVGAMYRDYQARGHGLSNEAIAVQCESSASRFDVGKVFIDPRTRERHPALDTMIRRTGPGRWGLIAPELS